MDKRQRLTAVHGDAIRELEKLPSKSVRLIVTDPPYNLNKDYGNNKDKRDFDDYIEFSRKWLTEAKRVLTDDGTMYVFMGMRYISYIYSILEQELGMHFNSWITWFYTQGIGKIRGYSPRHDDILMFTKHPKKFIFHLDDIRVPQKYYRSVNNMRGANPGNVWQFSHMHYSNKNRQNHPTQKPEALFERMILASSSPDDLVLDPFVGSGTTLRVCQQTGRLGIGIDINPEYIEMTKKRLKTPFSGFDSIDVRMKRVPNDLNNSNIREDYIKNHIKWFLNNHPDAVRSFMDEVNEKYGHERFESGQHDLFEQL
ncbi:DNA-methyltransferase [Streptococcus anginosus]|uniref:DNA-methyltransferase n=1 Tax=Streptococcus anginosus TaxID=1328 RepID=UPI003CF63CA5